MKLKKENEEKRPEFGPAETERKTKGVKAWKIRARSEVKNSEASDMEWTKSSKKHEWEEENKEASNKKQCNLYSDLVGGISATAVEQPRQTP